METIKCRCWCGCGGCGVGSTGDTCHDFDVSDSGGGSGNDDGV